MRLFNKLILKITPTQPVKLSKLKMIFCLFVTTFFFQACKIKYSLNGATIPIEAKTISVAFFTNKIY